MFLTLRSIESQSPQQRTVETEDAWRLVTHVGRTELRNPVIAGPADHLIDEEGVRRAIKAGVGAVVLKSVNETQTAKDQLQSAEYVALDEHWRPVPWGPDAPRATTIANRTGLGPASFDAMARLRVRSTARRGRTTPSRSRA